MFERFTQAARDVVVDAQEQARGLAHEEVRAEHLLLAVLASPGTAGDVLRELGVTREAVVQEVVPLGSGDASALESLGVDLDAVRSRVEAAFGPGALRPRSRLLRRGRLARRLLGAERKHLPFTETAKRALEQSLRAALALESRSIGAEHVLLGLVAEDTAPAALVLSRTGVPAQDLRDRLASRLGRAA